MNAKALFLGTGASLGIPVIGCSCQVCLSPSPFNKRLRSSLLLSLDGKRYLIDIGPDFRLQALKHQIHHLDGVILTHSHYDHIAGLDELRIFYFRKSKPVPCLVSSETFEEIKIRYHYILKGPVMPLRFQILEGDHGNAVFESLELKYFSYFQNKMKVTGLRLKNFAYVVDILDYSEDIFTLLEGVDTLIIDGVAWERTAAHLGICDVIEFAKKIGCKRTYLTHVAHGIDHEKVDAELPEGIKMAYDELMIKWK